MKIAGGFNKNIMIHFIDGNTRTVALNSSKIISYVDFTTFLQTLKNTLKDSKQLGIDIETTPKHKYKDDPEGGLDPYKSKVIMIQIGNEEDQFVIDTRCFSPLGLFRILLDFEDKILVGHNLKFEYKHIRQSFAFILDSPFYDTMIAEQVLYNGLNKTYALKSLALRYLKIDIDKDIRSNFRYIGSRPFNEAEIVYGARDVTLPLKIKELQKERTKKYELENCLRLEMRFIKTLGEIELKGMYLNQTKWETVYNRNLAIFLAYKNTLDKFVLDRNDEEFIEKQLELFTEEKKVKISWTSSQQVIEYFKFLGVCPKKISKTTKQQHYTVDATTLKSHLVTLRAKGIDQKLIDFIELYMSFKEYEQRVTTFGLEFFKYINPETNRVHSDYKQILNTGRISSRSPNLQNIPSDIDYRECFTVDPKTSPRVIVNADYSGQEQIILANKSKEPNLLEFYREGHSDMHSFVAREIWPELKLLSLEEVKKHHSEKRQIAKAAGFAINYGGNGFTIAKNLGIEQSIGDKVYENYFKAFPKLKEYFEYQQNSALHAGYILIDRVTKRKFFFHLGNPNTNINKIKRAALNFPIQGEAGSITKLACILFEDKIRKNSYLSDNAFISNIVHDEINVECKKDMANEVAELLEEAMQEAGRIWCKIVPLKATAVISDYWSH